MNSSLNLSQGWIFPKCFKTLSFSLTMTQTNFQTDGDSTHFHTDSKMIFLYNNQRKKIKYFLQPCMGCARSLFSSHDAQQLLCVKVQQMFSANWVQQLFGEFDCGNLNTAFLSPFNCQSAAGYGRYSCHLEVSYLCQSCTDKYTVQLNTISCRWDNCSANFIPVCVTLRRATDGSLSHVWQYSWLLRVYRGHGLINLTFITKKTFRSYFLMVLLIS